MTSLLVVLVAAPLLAGCMGGDEDDTIPYGSFTEAREAPGMELSSDDHQSLRLKLLEPAEEGVSTGELDVLVLVYDDAADAPVTDADFGEDRPQCGPSHGFCADMPDMGHGTSPEEAPVHIEHGVYQGMTTISMAGNWTLHLRPQYEGQVVEFSAGLRAA